MSTSVEPRLPPVELLEAVHSFPGPFVFKAIGKAEKDFPNRVVAAVREELGLSVEPRCSTRFTESGDNVAVTVEALARSAPQVQAVYRRLMALDGLLVLL